MSWMRSSHGLISSTEGEDSDTEGKDSGKDAVLLRMERGMWGMLNSSCAVPATSAAAAAAPAMSKDGPLEAIGVVSLTGILIRAGGPAGFIMIPLSTRVSAAGHEKAPSRMVSMSSSTTSSTGRRVQEGGRSSGSSGGARSPDAEKDEEGREGDGDSGCCELMTEGTAAEPRRRLSSGEMKERCGNSCPNWL